MRTFAQKPKATQQTTSAKSNKSSQVQFRQSHKVSSILHLQRTIGNQAVQRLLQSNAEELSATTATTASARYGHDFRRIPVHAIADSNLQPKLKVNAPRDQYEQEADRVADMVMRMPEPAVQRKTYSCGKEAGQDGMCEDWKNRQRMNVQRKSADEGGQMTVPPVVGQVLAQPGRLMDGPTRHFMASRFGHDFNDVRIHTGPEAGKAADSIKALAFTAGNDIVFGQNQYAPQQTAGRALLAHELVHVLQNGGTMVPQTVSRYYIDDCDDADKDFRSSADGKATAMAKKALSTLEKYKKEDQLDRADKKVSDLLDDHFGFYGVGPHLNAVIKGFNEIKNKFVADDYTYECEDDCDSEYAYVYSFWSDIHICMNKLKKKGKDFAAHVFLHEMSHYIAGTDDLKYYYYGKASDTSTLHPNDAISNADSYEGFADQVYKKI